ncbi:MAG: GAF domain-containing protein [Acidobacteriota bacterium]
MTRAGAATVEPVVRASCDRVNLDDPSTPDLTTAQRALDRSSELLDQGQVAEAIAVGEGVARCLDVLRQGSNETDFVELALLEGRLAELRAELAELAGAWDEADERAREALEAARRTGERLRYAEALARRGRVAVRRGRLGMAVPSCERALGLLAAGGSEDDLVEGELRLSTLMDLVVAHGRAGAHEQAEAALREARGALESLEAARPREREHAWLVLLDGWLHAERDRPLPAIVEEAVAWLRRRSWTEQVEATLLLAEALGRGGRERDGLHRLDELLLRRTSEPGGWCLAVAELAAELSDAVEPVRATWRRWCLARRLARARGDRPALRRALRRGCDLAIRLGHVRWAQRVATALVDGVSTEPGSADDWTRLGWACWLGAQHADSLEAFERARARAESEDDAPAWGRACRGLGRVHATLGAGDEARRWLERCLDDERVVDATTRAQVRLDLAELDERRGERERADQLLQGPAEEIVEHGGVEGRLRLELLHARRAATQGELGRARSALLDLLHRARDRGDEVLALELCRRLGELHGCLGETELARALLEDALGRARRRRVVQALPGLLVALARGRLEGCLRVRLPGGFAADRLELTEARRAISRGYEACSASGQLPERVELQLLSLRLRLIEGSSMGSLEELAEAERVLREMGDEQVLIGVGRLRAELLLQQRALGEALAQAAELKANAEASGLAEESWRAADLLARVHRAWGMAEPARHHACEAAATLDRLAASLDDDLAARRFLSGVERSAARAEADAPVRRRRADPQPLPKGRFVGCLDGEELIDELLRLREAERVAKQRRGRQREGLRQTLRQAALLSTAASWLAAEQAPPETVLRRFLERLTRTIGARRARVLVHADEELTTVLAVDLAAEGALDEAGSYSRGIVREALSAQRVVSSDDASADPRHAELGSVREHGLRSIACVPLRHRGWVLGALHVDQPERPGAFSRRDLDFLGSAGDLLGAGLAEWLEARRDELVTPPA